ncbi:type II toxin-antitoxin system prevent-host-death family antitoxin [Candidatus Binatia bacterium]|nr:type II toxin-antitoxin system prevent-host-death family antitoxin [Candidatus Binatia bacterium]
MVIRTTEMTTARWNVASAKAELSRVLERARRAPQIIEKRGTPIAVVLGIEDDARLAEGQRKANQSKRFLAQSAALRREDGVDLEIPERTARPSPFERKR